MFTCDFDHTLCFEDGEANFETLALLESLGVPFTIITTRKPMSENVDQVFTFIHEHGLDCDTAFFVKDEQEKLQMAVVIGSTLHFEDSTEAIELFKEARIPVVDCFNAHKWSQLLKTWQIEPTEA